MSAVYQIKAGTKMRPRNAGINITAREECSTDSW